MTIKIRICTKCGCLPPQLCLAVIFKKWPGPEDDSTHILTSNPIRWCKEHSQMNDYKYYKPTSGLYISLGNLPEKQITSRIACQWLSWPQESRTNGWPLTCCSKVLSSIMHTQKAQVEWTANKRWHHWLTGSFPSMASSQSFRLASEKACSVMMPCLWTDTWDVRSILMCT